MPAGAALFRYKRSRDLNNEMHERGKMSEQELSEHGGRQTSSLQQLILWWKDLPLLKTSSELKMMVF